MENGWDGLRGSKKATKIVNDLITADENGKRGFRILYLLWVDRKTKKNIALYPYL